MGRAGLWALLLAAAMGCASCGNQREAAREALREAEAHAAAGAYDEAVAAYRRALARDPYLERANLGYAELLLDRRDAPGEAAAYYRRFADLAGEDDPLGRAALARAETLQAVAAGDLVHPDDAVDDLLWAAAHGNEWLFATRLAPAVALRLRNAQRDLNTLLTTCRDLAGRKRQVIRRDVDARNARVRVAFGDDGGAVRDFYFRRTDDGDWLVTGLETVEDRG